MISVDSIRQRESIITLMKYLKNQQRNEQQFTLVCNIKESTMDIDKVSEIESSIFKQTKGKLTPLKFSPVRTVSVLLLDAVSVHSLLTHHSFAQVFCLSMETPICWPTLKVKMIDATSMQLTT